MTASETVLFILVPLVAGMLVWCVWAHGEIRRMAEATVASQEPAEHIEALSSVGLPAQYMVDPVASMSRAARTRAFLAEAASATSTANIRKPDL